MATKHRKVVTYREGLPPIESDNLARVRSYGPWTWGHVRPRNKLKIGFNYHNGSGHQATIFCKIYLEFTRFH